MLKIKFPSNYNQYHYSWNDLLVNYSTGLSLTDNIVFLILKLYYRGLRLKGRFALGKEKRTKNLSKIEFMNLMARFVGQDSMIVDVSKYGYKSYCRTWSNFNDLIIMTVHEEDLLQRFSPTKGDIVVDVGAYLGRYTLTSSNLVGKNGKVIAIEGDPSHYEMLNKNIKLNKLTNVTAINSMVGSKDMCLIVGPTDNYLMVGFNSMETNYQKSLRKEFDDTGKAQIGNNTIHLNTLDDLLIKQHGISQVNWMKVDVEGAELEVLRGAHNILSNSKRLNLLIEIHGINKLYKPIVELLNSYNFKIIFEKYYPQYREGDRIGSKHLIAKKINN